MTIPNPLQWWLKNPKFWFDSTPETDLIVIKHLGEYIGNPDMYESLTSLEKLIIDDQVARHYYRSTPSDDPVKNHHHLRALALAKDLIPIILTTTIYTPEEECFILMPLRHSFVEKDRIEAIEIIKILMTYRSAPIYERFLKAALIRVRKPQQINFEKKKLPFELICPSFHGGRLNLKSADLPRDMVDSFKNIPRRSSGDYDLVVSISGGSDSMLLLWTAHQLGYRAIALGIDYGNRVEHYDELYLVDWLTSQLGIPYYVRSIEEIKRVHSSSQDDQTDPLSKMRTFYEAVTREIRFSAYKHFELPVLLGHNWDDCFENCITNMISGRSPDNQLGMSFYGIDSGVEIYRPFLEIKKARIVELCNLYGIRYLVDSTPKWSRRGQIRDNIRPVLDTFDPLLAEKIVGNCLEKSKMVEDYQELVDNYSIIENKEFAYCTFHIPKIRSILFWRLMINKITKLLGGSTIKIGSIRYLLETIDLEKTVPKKITLSPTLTAIIPVATDVNFQIKICKT
jgi:tRNA(Ile)-lysidine synthase TilS/MesJ